MKKKISNSSLATRALLVSVKISQWTGRKTDDKATDTVTRTHKTDSEAGSYTKRLLPNAAELQEVRARATKIRKYFHDQTLPWMTDGSRIISAKNHLKFTTEIRKMTADFQRAAKDFEAAYPRLQAKAQAQLGTLYSAAEYPTHAEIKNKFKCEVNILPMPDEKDFRVEVSETEKKAFVEKMKEVEAEAMRSVWERLHGVLKTAAEKLNDPNAIFRDSLVENVTELCDLLPALNVSDDPKLDAAREDIKKLVSGHSLDTLRTDKKARKDVAKRLKDVTDKMGAFMGDI